MISIFEKKTKWIVLSTYNLAGNDYVLFARRGLKTNMLYFKLKNTTPFAKTSYQFSENKLVDIKEQFEKLITE